ncbi:mechanosensitive ion channel family protein [Eoetvoesiella caeni]|uniref:Small-conductance mechanosensitive channel n=1 Tax=Eoetvoesiella caeni TaxID=645616 RepID=A0A366H504_9BURK|nr:mechanosensitive ion channel family protein [Eoetvoesiella caeni]MCI2809912.1 mechanosensitive ion channel family protein [Eoetvoesiella caeni]NYT55788.1 mechanosensitive ion channel family protein [Eoetvoesiella caeni]RBP36436.1 small-conductance mechanosensitive channel [Eoetvoesiella caeni]
MEEFYRRLVSAMPVLEFVGANLIIAAVIFVLGWSVSSFAGRAVRKLAARSSRIDVTVVPMAYALTVWSIRIFVLIAVLARLGVQTASIIAMLGAAGLAIGLALQGTLQNIAAGIMLLALRPLRAGESVSVVGKADGSVEEVGLFLSRFRQADGTYITLPNSMVWGNPIVNYSRNATRRLDFEVSVRYGDDVEKAIAELEKMIAANKLALSDPKPQVMVCRYGDSTATVNVRVWALAGNYADLSSDLYRTALDVLQRAGMRPPIPLQEVRQAAADKAA